MRKRRRGPRWDLGRVVALSKEGTVKTLAKFFGGVVAFVAMNIAIADHLPLRYNIAGSIAFFAVIGLWQFLANRRARRRFYEPFNRR